jgi:selenocysteine lyase/cysteine desulfurase
MLDPQQHKFSLPQDQIYFNVAYMAPLLKLSQAQGMAALLKKANPTLFGQQDFFDDSHLLKSTFAQLISAPSEQIAIIPSVSYGMANAANNLTYKEDGEILCLEEQFPSNYYPWQRAAKKHDQKLLMISPEPDSNNRSESWNQNILSAINAKTTVVCMSHVHWADGTLYDLRAISQACKRHNAYLVIDGTQSVGALPLSIKDIPIDVLIVGGYKWLLGHYGMGLAYYSEKFNDGTPIEDNWINRLDSDNFQALVNYQDIYRPGATRYSVGEKSNFIHTAILQAGLEQILEWQPDNIQNYCQTLHKQLIQELIGTAYKVPELGDTSAHLTSIRLGKGMDMERIKSVLSENNIFVSYRGEAIRVSFYVFNTVDEVQKFAAVLKGIEAT